MQQQQQQQGTNPQPPSFPAPHQPQQDQ
jgi:hypothetical protein